MHTSQDTRGSGGGSLGQTGKKEYDSESSATEDEQDPKTPRVSMTPGRVSTPGCTPAKTPGMQNKEEEEEEKKGFTEADLRLVEQRKEVARLEGAIQAAQCKYK